jgi:DNA polymerase IV
VIVNDYWLTESIGYREMRDPDAKRFRIHGSVDVMVPKMSGAAGRRESLAEDVQEALEQVTQRSEETPIEPPNSSKSSWRNDPAAFWDSNIEPSDALDEMIREMKDMQDIPLDQDDDHATMAHTSFEGADSDSDSDRSDRAPPHKRLKKIGAKNQFTCMEKHDGAIRNSNPNAHTIEVLQKMSSYYDRIGDTWRTLAYRRCMAALRRETRLVATKEEAVQVPNIGERLAAKIEEIVTTTTLKRLESTNTDPNDQLLHLFMGVYQAGYPSASKWIAQGHRTLEDLKTKAELTPNQRIGVEHYDDFQQRIPRAEVAQHAEIVRKTLREVDPGLQGIIGGSYRRGNAESGDIDLLITKEGASLAEIRTMILETVVPKLTKAGFLKAALARGTGRSDSGSKWHGASVLPRPGAPWRRIDLLFVPWSELGAGLIYFTGNAIFNRSMRLLASKKGMRLNQRGLYADVMRGQRRERIAEGRLLEGLSEEKIFEILGVPWRPPEHRKC